MQCNNCYKKVPDDSKFCPFCRARIDSSIEASNVAAPPKDMRSIKTLRNILGAIVGSVVFGLVFEWLSYTFTSIALKIFNPLFLVLLVGISFAFWITCVISVSSTFLVSGRYTSYAHKLCAVFMCIYTFFTLIALMGQTGFNFAYIILFIEILGAVVGIFFINKG